MNAATRHFVYGATESIGDTLIPFVLTAARWAVLCWDFFSQPQAIQTYRWVGAMTVALAQLAWVSLVWAYVHIQEWAEREVQSCLQEPPVSEDLMDIPVVSELLEEMASMVEVDPFDPTVNPISLDSPVSPTAGIPSRDALRKEAKAKKIPGYSRMTKTQLLESLGYV